jgi:hypothetical protein
MRSVKLGRNVTIFFNIAINPCVSQLPDIASAKLSNHVEACPSPAKRRAGLSVIQNFQRGPESCFLSEVATRPSQNDLVATPWLHA